ncbi:MAG: hypothetical protein JKX92_00770 [Porticoccaceae bacterium]|nr:hypothetical protein [Porticoccaceae bacterium]
MSIYRKIIRPLLHKIKRFRNFIRDLLVVIARGWDFRLLTSCDMNISKIPKSTIIWHPVGLVIGSKVKIGEQCNIRHNVTLGNLDGGYPVIGDRVQIGPGVIILGNVTVGDDAIIGAGATVLKDVPAKTIYASRFEPYMRKI